MVQKNGSRNELVAVVEKELNRTDRDPDKSTGFCFLIFSRSCENENWEKESRKDKHKIDQKYNLTIRLN